MSKLLYIAIAALVLTTYLTACEKPSNERTNSPSPMQSNHQANTTPKILFHEGIDPFLFELPSGALSIWRHYANKQPVLVLFTTHPFLDPVAIERSAEIKLLMKNGSDREIINRGQLQSADTLFLSPESVSIALENGFFSEIVIILPVTSDKKTFSLTEFQQRALPAGFFTETELLNLKMHDGIISGSVRGVPLRIAHPENLPVIEQPVVLHLDHGYFSGLYVNEIKTPAYQLVYNLAGDLRKAAYKALAVTISFSNREAEFSLESRFMLRDLAEVLRKPQQFETSRPENWELRAAALYASTMFSESRARELTTMAADNSPGDAAAQFAVALDLFKEQRNAEAFAALDRAVALDKGYGLAYVELADQGLKIGQRDKAIELLGKAAATFPELSLLRIDQAHYLIQSGRVKEARPIIKELRQLTWSPHFHPEIPAILEKMREAAATDTVIPVTSPAPVPEKPTGARPTFNHMGVGNPAGH